AGVTVFHAGTAYDENARVVTAGGRILNVVGIADDVAAARALAYVAVDQIRFQGKQFRTDIAEER
ncbi:MAG: phosphoribosylamine--glycine ligase, partial [Acidimicrobiia bacterium]|nr:phosphoribosylamine--glycine ligase [Acidimicrobiia bacterium]